MRNLFIMVAIATTFIIFGCQKNNDVNLSPTIYSMEENGNRWPGWRIDHPISVFDTTRVQIIDHTNFYGGYSAAPTNDAKVKLTGKVLPNTGPQYVYAVTSFAGGTANNIRSELAKRGYTLAPLSYLIALNKEYGASAVHGNLWNTMCLDLPVKINFGKGGEENAGVLSGGNNFSDAQGRFYELSLAPFSESQPWGTGMNILCLEKK